MKIKSPFIPLLTATLVACANTSTPPPLATPLPTSTATPQLGDYGCPLTNASSAAPEATVTLGPSEGLPPSPAQGESLIIIGTVYAKDCTPLPNTTLEAWQTDANGEYGPGHGTNNMQCCYYLGTVTTDAAGRFQIITVRPGHYAGETSPPPAHIHVRVLRQKAEVLETEFVFRDDPHLLGNPLNSNLIPLTLIDAHAIGDIVLNMEVSASQETPVRTFRIVSERTTAAYEIRETFARLASMITARAVTPLVEGEVVVDLSAPPSAQVVTMTVDLRGLNSGEPKRDEKLADQWVVTNEYPFAYFVSTEIHNAPQTYTAGTEASFTLAGDLTIREITRPVKFTVRAALNGSSLTGSAKSAILMSDFGIEPPNIFNFVVVEDEVKITVDFVAWAD